MNQIAYDTDAREATVDALSGTLYRSWDDLFGMDPPEVERFQLDGARRRVAELAPRIPALRNQLENSGLRQIDSLADIVPLLFQHTVYKSYPASLIEKGRFDLLTRWLDGLTLIDLSGVDTSRCEGIDDWLDALETQTPLWPFHTSGTSGKLSFFPRTVMEASLYFKAHLKRFESFAGGPGVELGGAGVRMPVITPAARHGRYTGQRVIRFLSEHVAPTPEQCYTLNADTLSADVASLSGRIRMAQAKGQLSELKLTEAMRAALIRHLEQLEQRPAATAAFLRDMIDKLAGERVFISGQAAALVGAAQEAAARGLDHVFSPDGLLVAGGGGKGVTLPPDWYHRIQAFTGIRMSVPTYGMSELTSHFSMCQHGYYHIPPFIIPFLLDPVSGAILPRSGAQTGRFAALDLLPSSYWGGIISGDKITVEWDRQCPCGRTGAHVHDNVTRYDEALTGDDKVTCAATIDNSDGAFHRLLAL